MATQLQKITDAYASMTLSVPLLLRSHTDLIKEPRVLMANFLLPSN